MGMGYLLIVLLLFANTVFALDFSSDTSKATVIELYTSEGCSSCPPADTWLSHWKQDPRLFKTVIPMAFHVDYWNQLGWVDHLAKAEFSARQHQLKKQSILSQVYTPAFVVQNHEWRGWYRKQKVPVSTAENVGILSAHLNGQHLAVHYSQSVEYVLNIVYLGVGITTKVTAGENRSRQLVHDFAVLTYFKKMGAMDWELDLPAVPDLGQQRTAISIWITKPGTLANEQAAAAFID